MTKKEKIELIKRNGSMGIETYIHALGNIGNGLKLYPDGKIYMTKYVYDDNGTYYGNWSPNKKDCDLFIDWRRQITGI